MKANILNIIVLSIFFICVFSTNVFSRSVLEIHKDLDRFAEDTQTEDLDINQKINPSDWKPDKPDQNSEEFNTMVGKVLGVIQNFGIVASVITLMIIGLRTMYGSLEDKSHYKELLPTFLIGVFILLSCTTIPNIIYQVASKFNEG